MNRMLMIILWAAPAKAAPSPWDNGSIVQEFRKRLADESAALARPAAGPVPIAPDDAAAVAGFPPIGKWLLDSNGDVAHWLGDVVNGRRLDEPINVVIQVAAPGPEVATQKLMEAASIAGFLIRPGHSGGYQALLGGRRFPQIPDVAGYAYSDGDYFLPNNHGRLFGPVQRDDRYCFIGAFSRENVDWIHRRHPYASFKAGRDRFAERMRGTGLAAIAGAVPLGNAIPDDGFQTTGDHDGSAVLLELK